MKVRILSILLFISISANVISQTIADRNYVNSIQSVQLTVAGKPLHYPIINLGEIGKLRLDFDDLDTKIKNYYYTFVHCNADWQPSSLFSSSYIKGFISKRITDYKPSSISKTKYIHYTAHLPEKETMPTHSGNYILKVFLDGDTAKTVFTRRLLIAENLTGINVTVKNPFDAAKSFTHQKINFEVNVAPLNVSSAHNQIKVFVLQNYRWDNAVNNLQPNFIRGNVLEYNDENTLLFEAGKEYRWLDITDMRMRSDKVATLTETDNFYNISLHPESDRTASPFIRYDDYNDAWIARTTDPNKMNPNIHGDYALVTFKYAPSNLESLQNKNLYIAGRMTNYVLNDKTKMNFNPATNAYELTLLLKEGYYTYMYVTTDKQNLSKPEFQYTEGNDWQTENIYAILVYYRGLSDFADRLVGVRDINSVQDSSKF